jgi:predicted Zn-dependent protease
VAWRDQDSGLYWSPEGTPLPQNTHEFSKSDGLTFAKSGRMTRKRGCVAASIIGATMLVGASLSGQTRIEPRKNSFKPSEDVQLGRQAAAEVRQQLPILRDRTTDALVDAIGRRLVASVPDRFKQPAFRYSFDVVNLREINAFALPGGPMFLHRGMLQAARTDDEVAGVMAHELSHVVLRHGTLQAAKAQKFQLGALAGQVLGAIVGGQKGAIIAQGSQFGLGTYFLKYSREYEREADLLGAQMMARAGYDPRQMANMFRTIQQQGGNSGPEFLSDHPDPGNRYDAIVREARSLRVTGAASTGPAFHSVRSRLAQMPPAPTSQQVARANQR